MNVFTEQKCRALQIAGFVTSIPFELREHYDMCVRVVPDITPMDYPFFSILEAQKSLNNLKNKEASSGPDMLKPEFYKALKDSQPCLKSITKCFPKIIDENKKTKKWGSSVTKMMPKTNKPTAGCLRPIALIDIPNKIFMTLNGQRIDSHKKKKKSEYGDTG